MRRSRPIAPTTTGPVLIPMRMLKSTPVYALDVSGERLEPFLDGQRGAERPRGVVLVGDRRAEERHHAVTEELVDRPLAAVDGREDHLEDAVHDAVDVLGVEALRHVR